MPFVIKNITKYGLYVLLLACTFGVARAQDSTAAVTEKSTLSNEFFVFDNGIGQGQWTPKQQAEALAKFGYAGIGYTGTGGLDERLSVFDQHNLKIFNLYVRCDLNTESAYGDDLKAAIKRLEGTDVALWLYVPGQSENDDKAVRLIREIADLAAASGVKVALYPHLGFYIADIEDALRIVRKVNRKNLGLTFNLCHELKAGNEARFDALLEEAIDHLMFVSINGADHEGGWDKLIQRLGDGSFDLNRLLQKLMDLGYKNPIGLQCFQVPGDTLANLEHNSKQWNAIVAQFSEKK